MFVPYEGETPMITEPKVEDRTEQHYVAIRTQASMQELDTAIPQGLGEVFAWLVHQGVAPSGAPFTRYLVIDMEALLDIEVGVPVATALSGDDRISAGVLPAGRYASLVYTGIDNGIKANWALLKWGAEKGLVWDSWKTEKGDAFGARLESFLTNPDEEPDRAKWETEVAIRLAEHQP
jgi:effector-binding domain-containing protein